MNGVTDDTLLGGRVRFAQPARGFRSGIEPILLAAAIPARTGQRVLEGGSGAGAALLCLAARVTGISGVGIERQPALAGLAAANAGLNRLDGVHFLAGDITAPPVSGGFDHAFANPPYHAGSGSRSPDPARDTAKRAPDGLLAAWAMAMGVRLRHRGTLTFILPAGLLADCIGAFAAAHCPLATLFPLWPRLGQPARLMLARGVRNGRAVPRLMAGMVLHEADGRFTPEADAILRGGAGLDLG